jgi:SAM-dependent methyltransferase
MTSEQPKHDGSGSFAACDASYLRNSQYGTPEKLNARIRLHAKIGTSKVSWFEWLCSQIEWSTANDALEVGCGTGILWTALTSTVSERFRVVLTDLSPAMVETSLNRARRHLENVTGVEADVQKLPFENVSFDLVIANQMLYHVPDPALALAEIRRVLRPGGTLVASTVGPDHLRELFEVETAVFGASRKRSYVDVFGSINGRGLLEKDFEDVEWRQFDDALHCTNIDDVVAYFVTVPPGGLATQEELGRLRVEVEHRMEECGGMLMVTKDSGLFLARRTR